MRSNNSPVKAGILAAAIVAILAGLALPAGRAAAEAPYFYDDLTVASIYDPGFDPGMRQSGLLALLIQGWSRPDGSNPRQSLADQDYTGQYRLQWAITLDPRYSLLVELKGSDRDQVIADDFFVRTEFVYQALPVAMWAYGGMRIPEGSEDVTVWVGLESMSHRIGDIFPGAEHRIPVGFRGYAELRYNLDANDPVLRLTALGHTLTDWGVPNLTLGTALDTFFQEGTSPRWILQAHADYFLTSGAARVSLVTGYGLDLAADGEQRVSLGVRAGLF